MKVIRGIHVLQIAIERLQYRTWVIIREDLRLSELRGDEVGGEEAEEGRPEQHRSSGSEVGGRRWP